MDDKPDEFDLLAALGADEAYSAQRFAIYLPNRDRDEKEVPDIERWVESAMKLLVEVNGGVTRLPLAEGRFRVDEDGQPSKIVGEDTTVVYSYIFDGLRFYQNFSLIKRYIDTFGKLTNQKCVLVEFSGEEPPPETEGGSDASGTAQGTFYMQAYYISKYPKAAAVTPWIA